MHLTDTRCWDRGDSTGTFHLPIRAYTCCLYSTGEPHDPGTSWGYGQSPLYRQTQRCVKGGPIGESAGIVDFDHIPNLCLGHEALLWSTNNRYTHGWEDGKSRWSRHGPSSACQ